MKVMALILAAGDSTRLGQPKAFVKLGTETLLERALRLFTTHPAIEHVGVVCRKQDFKKIMKLTARFSQKKVLLIIVGGKTRQQSSYNGLTALKGIGVPRTTRVLIHNVANPFITKKDVDKLLRAGKKTSAVTFGQPVVDTIKIVGKNGVVKKTLSRKTLWRIQTPQLVPLGLALAGHRIARQRKITVADDVSLVELLGRKVRVIACSEQNFKITSVQDMFVARVLAGQRKIRRHETRNNVSMIKT